MPELGVTLDFYKQEYEESIKHFTLPSHQQKYSPLPIEALETASLKIDRYPVVITANKKAVGFFVLYADNFIYKHTNNPNALLLMDFSVNYSEQGKGFAKRGLSQLKRFVRDNFGECDEVVLGVNYKNFRAQKLYEKIGFIDTGRRIMGENGKIFILNLSLI
ncbi:GNAT family N-acetyltransferase [Sporolactobacillus shoreae]|uniref:GNAT family N-acetyltransferase n=1 Tax=Sporolactobacillus shoreae TaxID=1465501 RepID=A0A4Z0GKN8_9BACL|nr:GNAT family N-acetyltransferase [Sporolactobacillus shoreae]TGA96278.1 GNAT family N-acetyltransferase [Sporolactobacillus shoreae]